MIKDKLKNAKTYYNLGENLKKGLLWLEKNDLEKLADGRYEIDGDKVFASIQTYETKDDANYESHRNYIDIQYMINGCEKIANNGPALVTKDISVAEHPTPAKYTDIMHANIPHEK